MNTLSAGDQRMEMRSWSREFGLRYPHTRFIDVVNEPLHEQPSYKDALGGDGSTGCDWVIWAYETTREYCLTRITCLMSSLNRVDQT
jgi:endo-1,4-beta-xylanase